MASINGIQLKNIKKQKNRLFARVDMDGVPIGKVRFGIIDNNIVFISFNAHYYSDMFLSTDINDIEFLLNNNATDAISKDEINEEEFYDRVEKYFNNNTFKDLSSQFQGVNSFFLKLYSLYEEERLDYKTNKGNISNTKKYNFS